MNTNNNARRESLATSELDSLADLITDARAALRDASEPGRADADELRAHAQRSLALAADALRSARLGRWESVAQGWRHTVTGEVRRSPYDPATIVAASN